MLAFGPVPWGPALGPCAPKPSPTPVGEKCLYCDEPIAAGDSGVIMSMIEGSPLRLRLVVEHRECLLRRVLGSVGHQLGRCGCFGGTEEDPPGMTLRDGARAAASLLADRQGSCVRAGAGDPLEDAASWPGGNRSRGVN